MEKITNKTFEKKCPLLKIGYKITGHGANGIMLKSTTPAIVSLLFVCGGCKFNNNGCQPSACEDSKTEINVKIG